ncbi:MAG: YCF48-related protein, partial [Syntrophothermus sp.]
MIYSNDFGESWTEINNNITSDLHSIYFIDSLIGWCAGKNVIYKTTDGGLNWNLKYTANLQWFNSIRFVNQSTGLAVGVSNLGGIIYKTTDGGENWSLNHLMFEIEHTSLQFITDSTIYIFGENSFFFKSTNQGYTWDTLFVEMIGLYDIIDIYFLNDLKGWVTDVYGVILYTSNGGENWTQQRPNLGRYDWLESIVMFDSTTGWAVGTGFDNNTSEHFSAILKTTNGGITFVENDIEINNYLLNQNYPNPFNPSTKIKYNLPKQAIVTIKVYDVLGNEIKTLINEEKPSGEYEVEFDGSSLSSGIYFYQIQSGEFLDTKKMVMVK